MSSAPSARVLVVEDDESIRATLLDILDLNGFEHISATHGEDGLARAQKEHPDIILTDIAMPGMTGFEMLVALKSDDRTRAIPVIMITASVEPERMREAMNQGAEDFILKPFTEDQVLGSIRARLEKKSLLDELDAFAHTVAHDLKNPIAVLMGRAGLLKFAWQKLDEPTKLKHITDLENSALQLSNIVDELLVLAGVRRQNVVPKPVDMAAAVSEALGRIENLVKQSGMQLEQPAAWPTALGHAPWVVEIWANYLSNAAKYGGQPPHAKLGADVVDDGKAIRFWIHDNGPGLTAEQQSLLFRQFSRVTETRIKGHGLGLSIVRRIAEKLKGQAGVESQPGQGSRFWFELPQSP